MDEQTDARQISNQTGCLGKYTHLETCFVKGVVGNKRKLEIRDIVSKCLTGLKLVKKNVF